MFEDVVRAEALLAGQVAGLEPGTLSGDDAARLLDCFTRIERLATAGRLKVARRVEQSNVWRGGGHKTAAEYLARHSGESLGSAHRLLDTAEALAELPATAEAFDSGRLS
ncbi:MAG TPA: DUF222 domain-containing protein, partial [Acidimicrobiales bacterium]|nr:DUF222 domain-containing protein [Acidimicrobiales bacterium]